MPLEILLVCSWYPHADSPSNGIFIRRHAQSLALQHKVTVVFAKASEHISEETVAVQVEGNLTEIVCLYPRLHRKLPVWKSIARLRRYVNVYERLMHTQLDLQRFDLIHLQVVFPAAIPLLRILQSAPKPLFITEHWSGYYPEDGNYKGFYVKRITQKIIANAKAVCVISEKLKLAMQAHGLKANYALINNAVDTAVFRPSGNRTSSSVLRILHVSSLVEREKNISGLFRIMQQLQNEHVAFSLTIVGGDTDAITHYKTLAVAKGLQEQITFVGQAGPAEVASHMNAADVFLLFSHFEGMPVVLLEAMSCGLPVISTNVGAVPSMIPEGFGRVLPEASVAAGVQILKTYRRSDYQTPERMHGHILDKYSYEAVCNQHTAIYNHYLS